MVAIEVFPIVLLGDIYKIKLANTLKHIDRTYYENMIIHHFRANFEIRTIKIDDYEIPLQIWDIPDAGKLLTNYNKNIPDSSIQRILEFFDKVKIFIIAIDQQNQNYEFLERILSVLKRNYSNSYYFVTANIIASNSFTINKKIKELQSQYPKLKEFLLISEEEKEYEEKLFNFVRKIIIEEFIKGN